MNRIFSRAILIAATVLTLTSCDKNDDNGTRIEPYTIPDTYNFENVEYAEATASISMWSGLSSYLGKGNSRQLSQDTANNLWNNTNSPFTTETISNITLTPEQLNQLSDVNLAGRTEDATSIKSLIDSMVNISQFYNTPGSEGQAGIQVQQNGTTFRIFNHAGLEFNQAVSKGLMGAFALHKIFEHLDNSTTADNNTVTPGQGTAMEHQWDLAFGYVGIPKDYDSGFNYGTAPVRPDRPLAIGGYFGERGKFIKAGGITYEAFRVGRAAIAAKDYAVRDQAILVLKDILERTLAAAAYNYVTSPQTGTDLVSRMHGLSEGYGFMLALKHRSPNSRLSSSNYQIFSDIMNTSFYELLADPTFTKLKQAQTILTTAYGQLQP